MRFSDGFTRRDLLHLGAMSPLGLSLAQTARANPSGNLNSSKSFGAAKRCILLYLWGSPSQLETFDPKPDAPLEVRGEFLSIPTAVPGVRVGEILPRIAGLIDQVTILRTLTHPYPIHGTAFALSGVPITDIPMETNLRDPRHWPFIGSVVDYLGEQADPIAPAVPRNFGLPFPIGSKRRTKPGPFGGFLGSAYDTIWSEFMAEGTREVLRDAGAPDVPTRMVADPYLGILPTDRLESIASEGLMNLGRLNGRTSLLDQLELASPTLERKAAATSFDRNRALARSMLTSGKLRARRLISSGNRQTCGIDTG